MFLTFFLMATFIVIANMLLHNHYVNKYSQVTPDGHNCYYVPDSKVQEFESTFPEGTAWLYVKETNSQRWALAIKIRDPKL